MEQWQDLGVQSDEQQIMEDTAQAQQYDTKQWEKPL